MWDSSIETDVSPLANDAPEADVQEWLRDRLNNSCPEELEVRDTSRKAYLTTQLHNRDLKPDLSVVGKGEIATPLTVSAMLEVKSRKEHDLDPSVGQVVQYLEELMFEYPHRKAAVAMLLSDTVVRFFLWTPNEKLISTVLVLQDHWRCVLGAAFGTRDHVTDVSIVLRRVVELPELAGVSDFRFLGSGVSSVCYSCWTSKVGQVAVKVITDPGKEHNDCAQHEGGVLQGLARQGVASGVPTVVKVLSPDILITQPVASAKPDGSVAGILADLAKVLHEIHLAGYVHCDVRDANVCFTDKGVMLIDFGEALEMGSIVRFDNYSGTLETASRQVISLKCIDPTVVPSRSLGPTRMTGGDDMESLAKLGFLRCISSLDRDGARAFISSEAGEKNPLPRVFRPDKAEQITGEPSNRWKNGRCLWDNVEERYHDFKGVLEAARAYRRKDEQTLHTFIDKVSTFTVFNIHNYGLESE